MGRGRGVKKGKAFSSYIPTGESALLFVMLFISVFFSITFSVLSTQKYYSMHATGYDLGLFSQIFFNTLHGGFFYTNLLGESYLTEHFSPIVFLILPFYAIHSSPATLLWIQGFALGMAAIPLYLLTRTWLDLAVEKNGKRVLPLLISPLIISVSYLMSPMISGPISFDFHIMTLLPLFFFSSFYFFLKRKWIMHAFSLAMVVSLHSSFTIIVIFLLIAEFVIYMNGKYYGNTERTRIFSHKALKLFAIFIIVASLLLFYYYFIGYIKPVFSGLPPVFSNPSLRQAGSLSDSGIGLLITLLTKPDLVFSYLTVNGAAKGQFLIFAFATTSFTALVFPEFLLTTIPYILYGMFSSFPPYYTVGYQYTMMIIPMVYIAVAGGICRAASLKPSRLKEYRGIYKKATVSLMLMLILVGTIVGFSYTPISPPGAFHDPGSVTNMWIEHPSASSELIYNVSRTIPIGSSLVTQNDVFPFFSNNPNAYAAPWSPGLPTMNIHSFQYVVAYYGSNWVYTSSPSVYSLANSALSTGNFGVLDSGYGDLVLEQNYSSKPVTFVPIVDGVRGSSLIAQGNNTSYSQNGYLTATNITSGSTFFTSGTNLIFPGTYEVTLDYLTSNNSSGNSFIFNVSSQNSGTDFVSAPIGPALNPIENSSSTVKIYFTSTLVFNDIVFTGTSINWSGTVSIKSITMRQIST